MPGKEQFLEYFRAYRGPVYMKRLVQQAAGYSLSKQEALEIIDSYYKTRHEGNISVACLPIGPVADVDGFRVFTHMPKVDNSISTDLLTGKPAEHFIMDCFLGHIQPGDTVIDAGANIGYHTLRYARHVGHQGKVFSFEPDPWNFTLLQRNLVHNQCPQVSSFCCALGDHGNLAQRQWTNPGNMGDIRSFDPELRWNAIDVMSLRLDNFFPGGTEVHGIKIDTQGSEFAILRGAKKLVASQKRLAMLVEFAPHLLGGGDVSPEEFEDLLLGMGFRVYAIDIVDEVLEDVTGTLASRIRGKPKETSGAELLCIKD